MLRPKMWDCVKKLLAVGINLLTGADDVDDAYQR